MTAVYRGVAHRSRTANEAGRQLTLPWTWIGERRQRKRWLARRIAARPAEQLAIEAALYLEDPQPPVRPWPGGAVEVAPLRRTGGQS